MSPWNAKNFVKNLEAYGANGIILTDRCAFFGYNLLVNEYRCFPIMAQNSYPICKDIII